MDTSRDSGTGTLFLVTEPMTDEVESATTHQWAGVKRDRGQVAISCGVSGADLERFLVLSLGLTLTQTISFTRFRDK